MNNIEKMKELVEQLNTASDAYYSDKAIMSDKEWDALFDELIRLENETGVRLENSPTANVSYTSDSSLPRVKHEKPMLSADKTKSVDQIIRFAEKSPDGLMSVSWKEDGLTIVATYEDGQLTQLATRGNGVDGEDITKNACAFKNLPMTIPYAGKVIVRGEGTVSYSAFRKINAGMKEPYTLPRAYSGSSARLLDPKEAATRGLELMAFELVTPEQDKKEDEWSLMEALGFRTAGHKICKVETLKEVIADFQPDSIDYPVDGLIIQYNDLEYGRSLGATGHHERNKMALKWADDTVETRFRGIDFQPTRTGRISMTAIFDPVEIDGSTVTRATLHNVKFFTNLELGEGDRIMVYKANQVIPAIDNNLDRTGTYLLPTECPCCGAGVSIQDFNLMCENPDCSAKQIRKLIRFAEKESMDIAGVSGNLIELLSDKGLLTTYADFFRLGEHTEIATWEGWGESSFRNLVASVEKARKGATLSRLLIAMGLETVGHHASRDISKYFKGSNESFLKAIAERFDFTTLPNFGEISHKNIYAFFDKKENMDMWLELVRICDGLQPEYEESEPAVITDSPFAGKVMLATGVLKNFTRAGIDAKLESLGAIVASSVSKKTDYLIVGEKAGSKHAKAEQLGVKTLTEEEFLSMIGG